MRFDGRKLGIGRVDDDDFLHHAAVLMIENVAVEHEGARKIHETVPDSHAAGVVFIAAGIVMVSCQLYGAQSWGWCSASLLGSKTSRT